MKAETMIAIARHVYHQSADHAAERAGILMQILFRQINRAAEIDRDTTLVAVCAAAAGLGAGTPDLTGLTGQTDEDVRFWAANASPIEIEAVLGATLKAIGTRPVALDARKRAMVALWNTLNEKDRNAFLELVDPSGAGE